MESEVRFRQKTTKFNCLLLIVLLSIVACAPALANDWASNIKAGDHLLEENNLDEAEKHYQEALNEVDAGTSLAYTLNRLATVHRLQHHWQEALDDSQKALTIWNQKRGGASLESARTMTDIAEAYLNLGLPADTENYLRQALVITCRPKQTATLGSQFQGRNQYVNNLINDPSTIPGSPDAVRVLTGWVNYYLSGNHFTEAESLQKRSIEMLTQSAGYDNAIIFSPISEFIPWGGAPDLPDALLKLAEIYCLQGRTDQAEPLFEKAITLLTEKLGASALRTREAVTRHSNAMLPTP